MANPAAPLLMVPDEPEEELLRWRRWRRLGLVVAGASFLAAIAVANARSRPQQSLPTATGDSVSELADSVVVSAPTKDLAEQGTGSVPLPAAVDSLSAAITRYRDVENDHRRGRVGCRALKRAHARVVHANTRVSISRGVLAGRLDIVDSLRVSMTRAEYTHVSQMYRRSGCQG